MVHTGGLYERAAVVFVVDAWSYSPGLDVGRWSENIFYSTRTQALFI